MGVSNAIIPRCGSAAVVFASWRHHWHLGSPQHLYTGAGSDALAVPARTPCFVDVLRVPIAYECACQMLLAHVLAVLQWCVRRGGITGKPGSPPSRPLFGMGPLLAQLCWQLDDFATTSSCTRKMLVINVVVVLSWCMRRENSSPALSKPPNTTSQHPQAGKNDHASTFR